MEKIERHIKSYLTMISGMTVAMIVLGLIFIIFPGLTFDILRWIIAGCFIAAGLYMIIRYTSISGVITLLLGIIVSTHPEVMNIIPVLLGIYVILSGFVKLRGAASLKNTSSPAYFSAIIMNTISLLCGLIMVIHPGETNNIFMMILGVTMIVYGVSDFVDVMILRKYLGTFSKTSKKEPAKKSTPKLDNIKEAKVVKKK